MMPNQEDLNRISAPRQGVRRNYDRLSRWYDLITASTEERYRRQGLRVLDPQEGEMILEVGFGTGNALVAIAQAVGNSGKAVGVDLSLGMIAVTRAKLRRSGLTERVELICADALCLPLQANRFEAVFMSFTLELFDAPEIALVLAECRRVLRDHGRLCVVCLSQEKTISLMERSYIYFHRHFPAVFDCRPIRAEEELQRAGYQIERVTRFSLLGLRGRILLGYKR